MKKNVLIVNNHIDDTKEIADGLENVSTNVFTATNIQDALSIFVKKEFCLIILDALLSVEDDHKLLKAMRSAKTMPILVLSTETNAQDRIHAFQAGAHAYMGQPYTIEECMAQAHTLMQYYMDCNPESKLCYTLAFGKDLIIDPASRQVFLKGKELIFTKKEFDLLFCLASQPGRVFTREQLYDFVWTDQDAYNIDSIIRTHISSVKQKLAGSKLEYIKNVWGVGYRFHTK